MVHRKLCPFCFSYKVVLAWDDDNIEKSNYRCNSCDKIFDRCIYVNDVKPERYK